MNERLTGNAGYVKGTDSFPPPPDGVEMPVAPAAMVRSPIERRLVLVGRHYRSLDTQWAEWSDTTFDQVISEMQARRSETKANDAPDEIVEVIVVRSATIRTEVVSIEEDAP